MLHINNACIAFGTEVLFSGFSMKLERGETACIVGQSGCGKTSLLNAVMGFVPLKEGFIQVGETLLDISTIDSVRRQIAWIPQELALPFEWVKEMVALPFGLKVNRSVPFSEERLFTCFDELGLEHELYTKRVNEVSGGQRQRVAIARAIINQPRVVLLDEPLSALDLKLRTEMQYELRELQKRLGITFVFVTHDQEEALAMSDWIFVMNDGEIVQSGTPVDIYDEPINHFVATFIGESNILPGVMIEDYLVEFNGKRFESVDGGMRPNEPVEVVIRPEDLQITLPEEGKLQVRVETQLFRGVHYEIIAYDNLGNEWMIHSTRKAIEGEIIGLDFTPEDIHIMRLNETEEEFDARIEEYVEMEEPEDGLIHAIEEERHEENS